MANNYKFALTFDANLKVGQVESAIGQIQKALNDLHLSGNITRGLNSTFEKLSDEITNFKALTSKEVTSTADFNKIEKSAEKIDELYSKLRISIKDLSSRTGKDLEKLLPESLVRNISSAQKAIDDYTKKQETFGTKISETEKNIEGLEKELKEVTNKPIWDDEKKAQLANASKELKQTKEEIENVKQELIQFQNATDINDPIFEKYGDINDVLEAEQRLIQKSQELLELRDQLLVEKKIKFITVEKQAETIQKINADLQQARENLKNLEEQKKKFEDASIEGSGLNLLINKISELTGKDVSEIGTDISNIKQELKSFSSEQLEKLAKGLQEASGSAEDAKGAIRILREAVGEFGGTVQKTTDQLGEVEQLKKRITYFFGLNNTIQLVKRTMKSAISTIKELDAAMTATAVVTDFTVADMWEQLPEYTKRANELGVSTKAAYEAATLYYQQGLKTNEVMAISNETLKMARIAGLDAATATDRVTNAIRGFNMAINEVNAQRINDVYSRLAAISASNVDEISTAMTKVASLANSANMEFETTAAFLAQIVETTRESAETAGTALKTVIARFSEVKKLYSENELRGTDEEGLEIDVNKISTALRTAGIDLNKYFLGEVGLDDIFMELASKWDKLTSVQQRYIATQAAGSRQQSRFIALMSNYARTQELVGEAYNSNGAAAKQFAKTQESLESKLARLKNAWNEFAMGILNSDLVKFFVDGLTVITNFVNELTSLFGVLDSGIGGVISSLLKLTALVGGLSLGKNLLNGLFDGKLGEAGGVTGALFSSPSLFKKIGGGAKALWGGIQNIGLNSAASIGIRGVAGTIGGGIAKFFGGSSGAAAGLSGLLTIGAPLAGITAAAALAYKGIKKLYDLSPEGQVKIAEKYAESLHKVADSAKDAADELKSIKDEYANYSKAIDEADNSQDRSKAIQDRNEYITSLLEKNAEYVKYLSTTFEDGEIKLVLDEDAIANAVDRAAEAARKAQGYSSIGDAAVAQKQARLYKTKSIEVDRLLSGDVTLPEQVLDYWFNGKFKNLDSKKAIYESQASKYSEQAKTLTQQAIYQLLPKELSTDINGQDIAALIGSKISKIDLTQEISDKLGSLDDEDLKNLYEDYFGAGSAEGLKDDDMRLAIASIEALSGTEEQIDRFLEALQGPYTDEIREVLSAISGKGVTQDVNLLDPKLDDYDIYLKLLNKLPQEGKDAVSEIIGSFYDELMAAAKAEQKRQKKVVSGLYSNLLTSGATIDQSYLDQINRFLSPQQLQALHDVTSNFKGLISDDLYKEIFSTEGVWHFAWNEDLDKIQEFVSNFNLDNPINAFLQLKEAKEQAADGSVFQKLLLNIEDTNQSIFESSNLLKTFIQSSEYDELTESVHEFIEENGRLTPKKIEELAKESKTLKTLIDDVGISVNGLAKALTAIDRGAPLEGLTQAVLNSFSAVEDFDTALQEMYDTIDNFDPGRSYGEGTEFIAKQLEALQELIDKRSFGGEQFKNIYTLLFGEKAYNEFFRDWGTKGIEEYVEAAQEQLDKLNNYVNYNSFGFMTDMAEKGQLGISFKEGSRESFNWEIGTATTEDLVKEIQQLGYNKQVAQMLLLGYAEQSYDFSQQLKENDYEAALKNFINETKVITYKQLETFGLAYDKKVDEINKDIEDKKIEFPKVIDYENLTSEEVAEVLNNISSIRGELLSLIHFDSKSSKDYIDADGLVKALQQMLGIAQEEAKELAGAVAAELNYELGKEVITYTINPETGEVKQDIQVIRNKTYDAVESAVNDAIEDAKYEKIANALVNIDWTAPAEAIGKATATALEKALMEVFSKTYQLKAELVSNSPILQNFFPNISNANTGLSEASGDSFLTTPGWALTGEEGPEIVWNKEKGYSYITGQNGPEFRTLQYGDRIFNAQDTSRILKHSSFAKGGVFRSYSRQTPEITTGSYSQNWPNSSGSGGGSAKQPTKWRNELDWLYNLMEDIAELERSQTKLQEQHDRYLEDISKTGRDLYEISNEQLNNLRTQLDNQREALARRRQEMAEQLQASGYTNYVWWNDKDKTIEIDWDAIEAIQDKDTYDAVSDLISKVEKIQDEMDTAEDALWDIEGTIKEIENRYLEEYTNFQKRIYDAVVNSYQEQIDKLSQLNDTLNDSNNAILSSLQHEIELQRQIRDNTDTENNIRDMEARLAYLRRDTTGANESEIRALEKQLEEARQNYADTLIDQSINRLQESNDKAAEQREKQISLLTAQLDYWKETGALWPEVATLLETGLSEDGALIGGSALEQILRDAEDWKAMSEQQREVWANELITSANQAGAYLLKISEGFDNLSAGIWALIPQSSLTTEKYQYATGGLASYTGPAWLDGTPQEPEYVLNARQTDAFLRLAEVLPSMFENQGTTVNNLGHDIYVEFNMNVDKITSDYDVDRIVDRVKEDIYNISSYRNVNSISFSR